VRHPRSIYPASRSRVGWALHDIPHIFKVAQSVRTDHERKGRAIRSFGLYFGSRSAGKHAGADLQRFQQPRA